LEEEEDDDEEHDDDVSIGKKPAGHANWSTRFQHLLQVKRSVALISFWALPSTKARRILFRLFIVA
jgi:hypothetical protein